MKLRLDLDTNNPTGRRRMPPAWVLVLIALAQLVAAWLSVGLALHVR